MVNRILVLQPQKKYYQYERNIFCLRDVIFFQEELHCLKYEMLSEVPIKSMPVKTRKV